MTLHRDRKVYLSSAACETRRDPLRFLQNLAEDYGDVACFRIGRRTIYQFNHPDHIRDIFVTKNRCFRKTGLVLQARPILGNGLLTSEEEFHTRQRRMIQPALAPNHVKRYASIVTECAVQLMNGWQAGQSIDLYQAMLELTLKIIAKAMFNVSVDSEARELEEAIAIAIEYFDKLLSPSRTLLSRLPSCATAATKKPNSTSMNLCFESSISAAEAANTARTFYPN